ncbi:MAG: hypothetical protein AABY10_01205 [Nanoarchaeota archaeon]
MKLTKTKIDPREAEVGQVVELSLPARTYDYRVYPLKPNTGRVVKVTREAIYLNPLFLNRASKEIVYSLYQMPGESPFLKARYSYSTILEASLLKLDIDVPRLIHPDQLARVRDTLLEQETSPTPSSRRKFDLALKLLYEAAPSLKPKEGN